MSEPPSGLNQSIKFLVWEGIFSGVLCGFVEVYAAAYCLLLGAGPAQIALLASLPIFFGALFQLKAPLLIEKLNSRKKIIRCAIWAHALLSFLMAFAFLAGNGWGVGVLIASFCFYSITGQIASIAWTSWVGDLVPANSRGQFFGRRTQWNHVAIFVATLAGGGFLHWMKDHFDKAALGFCILYIAGGCFRLLCLPINARVFEPPPEFLQKELIPGLGFFLRNIFRTNFGRFVLFAGLIQIALYLANPFVAPYFLKELKINYFIYSMLFATLVVGKFAFYPFWGGIADKKGVQRILRISTVLFSLAPLFYLASSNIFYLFWVQTYRAITWSGYEVTCFKFQMDATTSQNRSYYTSYLNAINGLLAVLGSIAGSFLVRPFFGPSVYHLPFLAASVVMILGCAIFLPQIWEPQSHESSLTTFKTAWPMAGAAVKPGESVPKT